MAARLLSTQDVNWDLERAAFNILVDQQPAGIALPQSADEVSDVVRSASADGKARVGAGALWGDVIPRASEFGLAALHGSAPNVGIAGYTLGGGLSFYVRKHGLACNRVTAMDLVVAGGEQIRVDAKNEPDL